MTKTSLEISVNKKNESIVRSLNNIPRGQCKSGRVWKVTRSKRHSDIKKGKAFKSKWTDRVAKRAEHKSILSYEKRLLESRNKDLEEKRLLCEEKKKQKELNALKSEVVQRITNPKKIKKMSKKQLRQIAKR